MVSTTPVAATSGTNEVRWSATTATGQPLATGTYLLELQAGTHRTQQRVVVLP